MSKDQSEPAFPFEGGDNNGMQPTYGMSLRDYFAAKAMAAILSNPDKDYASDDLAETAYGVADWMLAERAK